jgi:hypothetical protein
MRSIEEIKTELAAAIEAERIDKEIKQMAVVPIYEYTLYQDTASYRVNEIFDSSCKLYLLTGKVLNHKEMRAVGKTPFEGSMAYLFNTLSGNFVMAVGGGSIFISNREGWLALSEFVSTHPHGGDVTEIVEKYRTTSVY